MERIWSAGGLNNKRSTLVWLFHGALILTFLIGGHDKGISCSTTLQSSSLREVRGFEELASDKDEEIKSLVFVFDVTGSMHDDLEGARHGAKRILKSFLSYKKRPVSNYVLVPFNDPDFGPVSLTEDSDKFLDQLNKLTVGGGGDCPEMSLSAIKEALDAAHPYSYLYVFTDASAKDYARVEEILKLIQRKHSQVIFFITGYCTDGNEKSFQVYEEIASASFGQMYYLLKSDVDHVLKSVLTTTKPNQSNLLLVSNPVTDETNSAEYNMTVESDLKELVVEVTGDSPEVVIKNPLGNPPDKIKVPIDLPSNKFVIVEYPKPAGIWVLKVTFHPEKKHKFKVSHPMITVKGIGTDYDIKHGFSLKPAKSLLETAYRPLEGADNYLLMEMHSNNEDLENKAKLQKYKWTSVDFLKKNGEPYMSLPIASIAPGNIEENRPKKYLGGPFSPPAGLFNLAFQGFDEDGNPVTRLTANFISAQEASTPFINMAPTYEGITGKNLTLKCEVETLLKFSLQWYRKDIPYGEKKFFMQSSDASLVIENIKKEDEGKYKCEATNAKGSVHKDTTVSIIALPEITGMEDTQLFIPEGKSTILNCNVISDLVYDVKWLHKHEGRVEEIPSMDPRTSIVQKLENNSLSMSLLNKNDSGLYVCSATNRAGTTLKEVEINVFSSPEITTSPVSKFEFRNGESIHINCSVFSRTMTKIYWEFNGAQVGNSQESTTNYTNPLFIPFANGDWEGSYVCIAENDAGRAQKEVKGIYTVPPVAKADHPYVAVKVGEEARMKCSVSGRPTPDILWTVGDRLIENGPKYEIPSDGSSLRILKANFDDEGTYKCVAKGPRNSESIAEMKLRIGTPPKTKYPNLNSSLDLGEEGLYPCEVEKDVQNDLFPGMMARVSWIRQNKPLDSRRQKVLESGALNIKGAEATDEGLYVCSLRNEFGETHMSLNLQIRGLVTPQFTSTDDNEINFKMGETIILWCNTTGNPKPRTTWVYMSDNGSFSQIFEDGYEEEGSILVSGEKLTLFNINIHFEGSYICTAENPAGIISKDYNVRMKVPPVMFDVGIPNEISVSEGDSYTLRCFAHGHPQPSIKWIKDGRSIVNITGHYRLDNEQSILEIKSLKRGLDNGIYRCIASNDIGRAVKKYKVMVT